ncbi:TPA: hypothetical protein QD004_001744 [Shewanella algae]|uniref:hypothetical protein n=1 Tax=Shewanella algae TaxID=38313 RepID=UPI001C58A5A9|nr:hypothetical protein [Shewanella algae]HDS1202459.1 hypothetical protein [Shewanella algae]
MSNPSGISRRIEQCIKHLQEHDYEGAMVNLFPAIDKTAKRRRSNIGVSARIKAFLKDEEVLITAVGIGSVFKGCKFDGMSFEDALYKFGRTSIAHEGEIDPRLTFNSNGGMTISKELWNLPSGYLAAMALAVIISSENQGERTSEGLKITIYGKSFNLNDIWGCSYEVKRHICDKFDDQQLFD